MSLSLYMARPEGFEPPTAWFVARYSIQLSYGRLMKRRILTIYSPVVNDNMAESEGFEPSMEFPPYTLSRGAPSATRPTLRFNLHSSFTDISGSSQTAHPAAQVCALFGTASLTPSGPARDARRSSWPASLVSHSANSPDLFVYRSWRTDPEPVLRNPAHRYACCSGLRPCLRETGNYR